MTESEKFLDKILTYVDGSDNHWFMSHKADIKAYAKIYHKEQLNLCGVSITLPPEENILNAMKLLAEIDYKNEWVWGHDTDLGKPKDVIEAFKNKLLGN